MTTRMWLTRRDKEPDQNYEIQNLDSLSFDHNSPVSPMPLPEETDEENILVKIEGNSQVINVSWTIVEGAMNMFTNGKLQFGSGNWTSVSGFTIEDEDTPKSVIAHMALLKKNFVPTSVEHGFRFGIYTSDSDESIFYDGNITQMSFSVSGSSPINYTARIQFMVGDVVALFEEDIPEAPQLISVVGGNDNGSGDTGTLTVSWKEFDGYATDQAPTLTGVRIAYRTEGSGGWSFTDLNSSSTLTSGNLDVGSYKVTGLKDSKGYTVKVSHVDSNNTFRYNYSEKSEESTTAGS